jgi:hypothetical protein
LPPEQPESNATRGIATIKYGEKSLVLGFRRDETVKDFRERCVLKLCRERSNPSRYSLKYGESELDEEQEIWDFFENEKDDIMLCLCERKDDSIPPKPAAILPVPPSSAEVAASPSVPKYNFEYKGDEFSLSIPDDGTVLDAKKMIAERYKKPVDYVSLLYRGRDLHDESNLLRSRIAVETYIEIYLRSDDAVLLTSIGPGDFSRAGFGRPLDFEEKANELQRLVPAYSLRYCKRCFIFYDYDFDEALKALQESLQS